MKLVIILFAILFALIGVMTIANPEIFYGYIEDNLETTSLYISAIVVRLVLGLLLIKCASDSRYPVAIKVIGFILVIAACIFLAIGQENFQNFVSSLLPAIRPCGRVGGVFALAFGGFLAYAFSRKAIMTNNINK